MKALSTKRRAYAGLMRALMLFSVLLTGALVLFLIGYVLWKGTPNITWELLSTKPSYLRNQIGILPDILNTVYIVIATLLIVLPLGVGAAIYMTEYARNKKLVAVIEYAAETLSGIPSIIYGLVGMLFFCQFLNMQTSLMAGALTLVIMNLPTIMRTTQESLKTVPQSYREGAFGLGAGKWRVIRTVVLPGCVDGVITGCILAVGRILGESAALLFTAGFAHALNGFFQGLRSAGATIEGEETPAAGARITKTDLYAAGLTGGADSKAARQRLLAQLDLPEHLSTNALLEVLNALMTREEFQKLYI